MTPNEVDTDLGQALANELIDKTVDEIKEEIKYTRFDSRLTVTALKTKEPNEKILTCDISFLNTAFLLRSAKIISEAQNNIPKLCAEKLAFLSKKKYEPKEHIVW